MPQLDYTTWPSQLFWLALCFIALYVIISRIVIPRTGGVIEQRKSTIDSDIASAQKLRADTEAAVAAYDASMAEARSKAQALAKENREKVTAEIDGERAALDAALGAKIEKAEAQVSAAKDKAMADVEQIAGDIATDIVNTLTGVNVAAATVKTAVTKAAK